MSQAPAVHRPRPAAPSWFLPLTLGLLACSESGMSGAGGQISATASGEVLALHGYAFPPAQPDDPVFVDGWEVRFDTLLVTLDQLVVAENPDTSPTDQSQTGAVVATQSGPWAVDLHKGGPLLGKGGGGEQALGLTAISGQSLRGDKPFDPTQRYAFGYDVVTASPTATRLGFDEKNQADYQEMIQKGWTVLYAGVATFRGSGCTSTNPAYDFGSLPSQVRFRFGFKTPTSYRNCQNPDNAPAKPFSGEEQQRGVQIKTNTTVYAQATLHADHVFWESIQHDAPAHFDPIAAHAKKDGSGAYVVTLDDLQGVNFTAFRDQLGRPLPWRSCLADYTPPNRATSMSFDSQGIPYTPSGPAAGGLRDFADYLAYNQSTQGHLNADGLCFVERHYPSPQ